MDLFFALSGYLITSILLREFANTGSISLGHFYIRRAARLMPALVLVLVAVGIALAVRPVPQFAHSEIWLSAAYLMNWARAFGWSDGLFLGHTWSLGIEEQYYLVWPPILLAILCWRPSFVLGAALLLAAGSLCTAVILYMHGASWDRIYNGADVRAVELLIGSAAAIAKPQGRFWVVPVLLITFSFHFISTKFMPLGGYGLIGLTGAWVVCALTADNLASQVLSLRPLPYIGRISYGIYLWHYPVLRLADAYGVHSLLRDGLVLAVTFGAAALSYHLVETPIRRAVSDRLETRPAQLQVA